MRRCARSPAGSPRHTRAITGESILLERLYKRGLAQPQIGTDLRAGDGLLMFWSHYADRALADRELDRGERRSAAAEPISAE